MRIARFTAENELYYGLVDGEPGEETLTALAGDPFYGGIQTTNKTFEIADVRLLSPIIPRSKVVGTARNWHDHAAELGNEAPTSPQFFIKPNTAVVGPNDPVTLPEWSEAVSFEGELAVVIGRIAKSVPVERVPEIIFGYTVANDLTARDAQKTDLQWTRAKGFDGACPLGPWIQTELDTDDLSITTWVDGDIKQEGTTAEMIFSVAEVVAAASEMFTLLPGDVILTGTPAGVDLIDEGAEVEIEVEGIGSLVNTFRR
ncbi:MULTISPECIES: fumarylacetoacetate hydrolase family protein [unclassified Rothia (in: high G+C Gram-positive bacteria)]|uniref:fumarylacetoacetate hydrolase family protein n=1 Tax=unclassified Rothia (in: high G+C Gram-positive bacteria) TaxID=2689056 RepID=UPI00195711DA|nr:MULTISPECIES: fumarylacetoacetate hydrolase family protein [unclassified Rothia (in: high G+C Gram-positive bacteria)]MBM7050947.1 fumarylacetoacetate hydrolase family protein [Rothia sp. ZJ1223]QRZ62322.1 fumarylacetoacetate hydrolase family protein [Rothia sp. ZJ932]